MWTSLIAKDAWIQKVRVEKGAQLGIYTTAGPTLCTSCPPARSLRIELIRRLDVGRVRPHCAFSTSLRGRVLHVPT